MFLNSNFKFHLSNTSPLLLIIVVLFSGIGFTAEIGLDIQSEAITNNKVVQDSEEIKKAIDIINQYINREGEQLLLDIIKNDRPGKDKALLLLGRFYLEEKAFDKAEYYLLKAYEDYPLLSDYALKLLLDVYVKTDRHEKVIETAPLIKSSLLMQNAQKAAISSLLASDMDREAMKALSDYINNYSDEWESKLTLATLFNMEGELNKSISLYKDIYLNAVPLSDNALSELKVLEADKFSSEEILQRADNLFKQYSYVKAEIEYNKVLETEVNEEEKNKLLNSIAMCQFRTKRYNESAETFSLIDAPEAMYWQARSYFRTSNHEAFSKTKTSLEEKYPDNEHIALLLLMEAAEFQRRGISLDAAANYNAVIRRFPEESENALWGLGWMMYVNGDYKTALIYLSQLTAYDKSKDFYKYIFWEAKAREKISIDCTKLKETQGINDSSIKCDSEQVNSFYGLPSDESYYGYQIKLRTSYTAPDKINLVKPDMPVNETNKRIEALSSLGMKDDAANEVADALKKASMKEDILYLGFMAMSLGKYKDIIYHAEPKDEKEFLPYSYPLAYWDIINKAAESGRVDAYLVAALIREESRFDPEVVSWAGAVGLMQLMPSTAKRIKGEAGVNIDNVRDLYDPGKNILLGTHYLSSLINEFNELPIAIMSYNAGENRVNKWLEKYDNDDINEFIENVPYKETRRYVKKVLKSYWQYRSINGLSLSAIQNQESL
jgi:soluble lytic murein transglycosylase